MVDFNEMRKKFPAKDPSKKRRSAAIKAIAREYEMKKAELNGLKAPAMKRGIVFYAVVIIGLLMLSASILSVAGKGGRKFMPRALMDARKSVDALATALGRYRYHVGSYPTTEEGLEILASDRVVKRGWNGPYIRRVVKDPWGCDYVYVCNGEAENPTLYSKGPDRTAGTTDDILPLEGAFEEPFKDLSWTKGWMPYQLRGYVLAPDEATKAVVEQQVKEIVASEAAAEKVAQEVAAQTAKAELKSVEGEMATAEIVRFDGDGNEIGRFERTYRWGRFTTVYDISRWNWTEGESVKVGCMATGDEVELFVNGESAGRIQRDQESGRFEWTVPFEPGEIKFIVFRDGHPIGEGWRKTAGAPFAVKVTTEAKSLADGDVGFARAELVDEDGIVGPSAAGEVAFTVDGPGELLCSSSSLEQGAAVAVFRRKVGSGRPLKISASFAGVRTGAADLPRSAD